MSDDLLITYRRADGELIDGEYTFVTDLDYFDGFDGDRLDLVEEHWERRQELAITIEGQR